MNFEAYDRIQRAAITLANKIIVADALDVQSAEDTQRALKKAAGASALPLNHSAAAMPGIAQAYS